MATKKTQRSILLEALEAAGLSGAELLAEVNRAVLKPGDLIVFKAAAPLRPEAGVYLRKQARRLFPDHEVIVLDPNLELEIVSEAEAEAQGAANG